jgi:hypothetical protein
MAERNLLELICENYNERNDKCETVSFKTSSEEEKTGSTYRLCPCPFHLNYITKQLNAAFKFIFTTLRFGVVAGAENFLLTASQSAKMAHVTCPCEPWLLPFDFGSRRPIPPANVQSKCISLRL